VSDSDRYRRPWRLLQAVAIDADRRKKSPVEIGWLKPWDLCRLDEMRTSGSLDRNLEVAPVPTEFGEDRDLSRRSGWDHEFLEKLNNSLDHEAKFISASLKSMGPRSECPST
jgi:hypothetical protein